MAGGRERLTSHRTGGDRCPGLLRLYEALDGFLARVRLPGGRLTPDQLRALAAGARHGNGIVELTSRANAQLRGLGDDAAEQVAPLLEGASLLPSAPHELARNILASPLAGRHPDAIAEVDHVVSAIDRGLCADSSLSALPGRFSFLVDDGSRLLGATGHDVALLVGGRRASPQVRLALAGHETTLRATPSSAAELALEAARAFLAERGTGRQWRLGELPDGPQRVAARIGGGLETGAEAEHAGSGSAPPPALGSSHQRDGRRAITALAPLGRLGPAQLEELASVAEREGSEVRISPWRMLSLIDIAAERLDAADSRLAVAGLVTDPASGWRGLSACSGLGACRWARGDVRAAAASRAAQRPAGGPTEHWTACERRCGERPDVGVAISIGPDAVEVRLGDGVRTVEGTGETLELLREQLPEEDG